MSDCKWTPGPWVIDPETRPAEVCTVHHTSHENGFVYVRGELGYWGAEGDESMANAQLIAAAPELYEALEQAVTSMQDSGYPNSSVAVKACRAALAKARGEIS